MSRVLAIGGVSTFILLVLAFGAGLAYADGTAADSTSVIVGTVRSKLPVAVGLLIAAAAAAALVLTTRTTERFAAPARAKAPEDRTVLDDAAIGADAFVDSLNIDRLTGFLTDFALSRLDVVLDPVLSQAQKAEALVDATTEAWLRRNPDVAAAVNIDPQSMKERLAAAVGKVMVDAAGAAAGQITRAAASVGNPEAGGDARPVR